MAGDGDVLKSEGAAHSDDPVRTAALDWFVRNAAPNVSARDRAGFEAWLAAAPRHREAYDRVAALWESDVFVEAVEALAPASARHRFRASRAALGLAVSVALVIVAGGFGKDLVGGFHAATADYATAVGETRVIALGDGSRVTLNTASAIDVEVADGGHRITLIAGEAYFEVRPNTEARSFTVLTDEAEVRVVGTAFSVRDISSETLVGVQEGEVAVALPGLAGPLSLGAGEALTVDAGGGKQISVLSESTLAWLEGRIHFHAQPFGEIIDELRRYHSGLVIIADERLDDVLVSGSYRLDSPVVAITSLASAVSADVIGVTDRLLILK